MIRTRLFKKISHALIIAVIVSGLSFSYGFADDTSEREIWLSRYTADIDEGESFCLKAAYSTFDEGSFTFESTNENVAAVSDDGKVTANSEGAAWISVSDGDLRATCSVYVSKPKERGLSLSANSIGIAKSGSYVLSAALSEAYKGQKIVWSSDNSDIASVNEGVITGVKNGQTTVRAALVNIPDVYDECDIMVGEVNTYRDFSAAEASNGDTSVLQYVYMKHGENEWKKIPKKESNTYKMSDGRWAVTNPQIYSGTDYDAARVFCAPASGVINVSLKSSNYFYLQTGEKPSPKPGKGRLEIILNDTVLKSLELNSSRLENGEYAYGTGYDAGGTSGINMVDWLGKLQVPVHKGDKIYIALRNESEIGIALANWQGFCFEYSSNEAADSIDAEPDSISSKEGKIFDGFKVNIKGNDFGDSNIEYLSGDETVAKVSKDGIIKGETAGNTRVYAVNRGYKLINYIEVAIEKSDIGAVNEPSYDSDKKALGFSVKNNGDKDVSLQLTAVLRDEIGKTLSVNVGDLLNVNAGSEKEFKLENIYNKDASVIDIYLIGGDDNQIKKCVYSKRIEIR